MTTVREQSLARLEPAGFRVARSLPTRRDRTGLRPLDEIARRLMALDALFTYVSQHQVGAAKLHAYAQRSVLVSWLTPSERAIWQLPRATAKQRHVDLIGWRLENMWPLAWILGFPPEPPFDGEMIAEPIIEAMFGFLPNTAESVDELLARAQPRPERDVLALEDLFYCAHNAARSAQLGGDTVPAGFHPIASAGVIHERRHALTWATSPGVAWDDTDLST